LPSRSVSHPQLLPAVVSTSLSEGPRQLSRRKVLVKRLVCIEDLGDINVLFTDKTGTLTEGSLSFMRPVGPDGTADDEPLLLGLLCNEAVVENGQAAGGNPLDVALLDSPAASAQQPAFARYHRLAILRGGGSSSPQNGTFGPARPRSDEPFAGWWGDIGPCPAMASGASLPVRNKASL
jgi:hypothetical protein